MISWCLQNRVNTPELLLHLTPIEARREHAHHGIFTVWEILKQITRHEAVYTSLDFTVDVDDTLAQN